MSERKQETLWNSIATVDPQYVCLLEGKQQHFDLTNQKRECPGTPKQS